MPKPTENLELIKNKIIPELEEFLKSAGKTSVFVLTQEHSKNFQDIRARFERRVRRYNLEIALIESVDFGKPANKDQIEGLLQAANAFVTAREMYARQTATATKTVNKLLTDESSGEKIREARAQNAAKARSVFDKSEKKRTNRAKAGGEARSELLKPIKRKKIAKKAAEARWKKTAETPAEPKAESQKPAGGRKKKGS